MQVLIFDTETTGLIPKKEELKNTDKFPYIVQISWLVYDIDNNKLLSLQNHIIKCKIEIPDESIEIHKITNEISQSEGISMNTALKLFELDYKKSDIIVAHNLEFDKKMYMIEALRNKRAQLFKNLYNLEKEFCTMKETIDYCKIIRQRKNGTTYFKYPKLCELYKIIFKSEPNGMHNSLVDVLICLRCYMFYKCKKDVLNNSLVNMLFERNEIN